MQHAPAVGSGGSPIVPRARNQSEVADARHTKKSIYGRGLGALNGEAIIGSSSLTVNLTPSVSNYGKKNIFATGPIPAVQGKVVGKRYSRN